MDQRIVSSLSFSTYYIRTYLFAKVTMLAAWLGLIGFAALGWVNNQNGSGYHQWDVRLSTLYEWLKVGAILTTIV